MTPSPTPTTLPEALAQLAEARDTLRAIQAGEVDAFVVSDGLAGHKMFSLSTTDRPYRMFVENMRDGAATISASGVVLYANDRLASLLGSARDEVVGAPLATFFTGELPGPEDGSPATGQRGATVEGSLLDRSGVAVPVLVGTSPLEIGGDRFTCLTFTDLTAQKAQEGEIEHLHRAQVADGLRFTAVVEALQEGVLVQDADGGVLEANQTASTILGIPLDKLVTDPPTPLRWRPAASAEQTPGRRALAEGRAQLGVIVAVERGNERVWLEINSVPFQLPGADAAPAVISSFRDITDRMRAEDRARRLSAIVDSSSDAIIGMSLERTITSWNPGATALFGYEADEALGKPVSMLAASKERDQILTRLGAAQGMRLTNVETQCLTKSGSTVSVSLSLSPILDKNDRPIGLSGIARDITERLELEQVAKDSRQQVLVARHEAELDAIARAEADRANQAKSEFLSRMSHELRTPLNAVLGFGQILLMDDLTADQRENVGFIRSAGEHLLDLINDVLDISRIEAGALHLSLEPVHLAEVTEHALSLIRPQATQSGISLPARVDIGDDVYVLSDRQRLLQVLLNLLSNAVKYNRPRGRIDIVCESSGGTVSIAVSDTGLGIAEADLSKLFTPFERLGAEGTGIEGTGVGLALARAISQQMGGSLQVSSAVGTGSTFTLEMTASQAPDTASAHPAVTRRADENATCSGARPVTILAIEDNVANIRLLERALQRCANTTLVTAIQGRLGLELAIQHHPDMVLLDLHLPDLPGDMVLKHLRADPATASIPVVICSADASPGQRSSSLDHGAAAYLTKPIDLNELYELIEIVRTGEPLAHHPTGSEAEP